jgi:hypothetical protein
MLTANQPNSMVFYIVTNYTSLKKLIIERFKQSSSSILEPSFVIVRVNNFLPDSTDETCANP